MEIPQSTVSRWVGNRIDRYDKRIIAGLLEYFDCEVQDLIIIRRYIEVTNDPDHS